MSIEDFSDAELTASVLRRREEVALMSDGKIKAEIKSLMDGDDVFREKMNACWGRIAADIDERGTLRKRRDYHVHLEAEVARDAFFIAVAKSKDPEGAVHQVLLRLKTVPDVSEPDAPGETDISPN